jgi:hypothetical protein
MIGRSIAISFVIVSFKFGKYFARFLDALTCLLYCVARIYSFAGRQMLMIAMLCDILQVVLLWTELRRSVREPMCWVCQCDGCVSDYGLSSDDMWSLVYSFGLS